MSFRPHKNISFMIWLLALSIGLSGCAGLDLAPSPSPVELSASDQASVGVAAEGRLMQLLGGPYHDKELVSDLKRLIGQQSQGSRVYQVSVADRGQAALYALPGRRIVLTRGLLAGLVFEHELVGVLAQASKLSDRFLSTRSSRAMNKAIEAVLSGDDAPYDPDSASIELARLFEQSACELNCLAALKRAGESGPGSRAVPESIKRLAQLESGYALLANARKLEKTQNQAQAIAAYLQAAVAAPEEPRMLASLGLAYLRAGQLQSARLHLEKAVKLQPEYYRTRMGLGYLYLQSGQLRKAGQALAESVRLLPVTENLFLLAEVREKSGDVEGAMALYRLVVASDRFGKLGRTSSNRLAEAVGEK